MAKLGRAESDALRFRSQTKKNELSHLYEAKFKNMGNAGRNGGEYYTPRPLIRAIIQVVQLRLGERIYDGTRGSAGFLCESFDYLRSTGSRYGGLTTKTADTYRYFGESVFVPEAGARRQVARNGPAENAIIWFLSSICKTRVREGNQRRDAYAVR